MILRAGSHRLELGARGGRALIMGILNATPDSFSDARGDEPDAVRLERGRALLAAGADIVDVGGESARGDRPAISAQEEIARVSGLVAALSPDVPVSVDTYKPEVAEAVIAAGATIINDVSGLRDPALAEVCAQGGAALVLMHTRVAPKGTLLDPATYDDVVADVVAFLRERIARARAAGLSDERLLVDPGPDFAKTPAQTVAVLQGLALVRALGRPLLLAVSRKDFLGAITGRPPVERDAATLAAIEFGVAAGASILRVHDVAGARDFLDVRAVLRGERALGPLAGLTPERYPDGVPDHIALP